MKYSEAVEEFLLEKAIETAEATQRYYRERLDLFQRDTGIEVLAELTPATVTRFLHGKRHLARASIENYRRAISVFAGWCYRRKYIDANPFEVLPKPRRGRNERPSTFTKEQLQSIITEAKSTRNAPRDTALVYMLLDTGIRIGEAAGLELSDIDWDDNLLLVDGKTGRRDVPFSKKTRFTLHTYVRRHRRAQPLEQRVFLTFDGRPLEAEQLSKHMRRIAVRAGVKGPKLGPHTFRHTFAHLYLLSGGDSLSLMRLMGHTTTFMTASYARLESSSLRQLHARHSPVKNLF